MNRQVTKDADEDLEEMFAIRPAEVTLTGAPAVREDFLMTKSAVQLNNLELHGLASKLGVDGIEAIPEVEISKAVAIKSEELKAEDDDKDKDDEKDDEKNKIPPQLRKDDDGSKKADDDDEDDDKDDELDLGKSQIMRALAPAILAQKSDLPNSVVKALEKIVGDSKEDDADSEAAKAVASVLSKSESPLVKMIQDPLLKQIKKSEDQLAELVQERDEARMHEIAKSIPGNIDAMTKRLVLLKKSMPASEFDAFVKEQQGIQIMIEENEMMKSIQGRGVDASDAQNAVRTKAEAMISKAGKAGDQVELAKAIVTVLDQEPALAQQYHKDMQRNASKSNNE